MDQMELYCPLAVYTANGGTAFAMEVGREGKSLDGVYCVCGKEYELASRTDSSWSKYGTDCSAIKSRCLFPPWSTENHQTFVQRDS